MEDSAFLPSPPNEQEKEKEEPNQGKKLNKALMGGLVVGLALLIVVIVIAVLATASAGDETSAVPQQLQMESTTTTTRAGTGATEEEQTVDVGVEERPWLEGDYKCGNINWAIVRVEGDSQVLHQLKFLDAESEAEHIMHWQALGNNTIAITLDGQTAEATVNGSRITGGPGPLALNPLTWIPPEEAKVIRNRPKQPVAAPELPYTLNPDKQGKLVVLTGPPGSGKSTVAGMIAGNGSWIFYEGDGFLLGHNPYVFPNESVVDVRSEKPALIGAGMRERMFAMLGFFNNQREWEKDNTVDRSPTEKFYRLMAEDIRKERRRVGGDWIVAFAMSRVTDRDIFREVLGEDLLFVVLDISLDLVKERLAGRGIGEEKMAKIHWKFQPAQEDEPKTAAFQMLRGVSKQDNADAVLRIINEYYANRSDT